MYFAAQSVLIANVHTCTLQEQYVFIHKALADYMMEKAKWDIQALVFWYTIRHRDWLFSNMVKKYEHLYIFSITTTTRYKLMY